MYCFTKVKTIFFSAAPILSLIPKGGPSSNTKKFFFRLSISDGEVLSTPKLRTFPEESISKLHEPSASNAVPRPLQINLLLIAFLTKSNVPNKQLFSEKLLIRLLGQSINS